MDYKNKDRIRELLQTYFREVRKKYLTHDYTEGTYRTVFENFIKSFDPNIELIHEPQRTKGIGAPDFKAFYRSRKVGYIETKDLDVNLDNILETEQLKRYKESINNLILTNYCRFMLIRNGEKIFDFNLFTLADLDNARFSIPDDKIENFNQFINEFLGYELSTISSAEELAKELSKKAKLLKDFAKEQLQKDLKTENGMKSLIYDFYDVIKKLVNDISIEDCADAYAQTITYGLFLAKRGCKGKLERINAASYIPKSVGIIKKIFINISASVDEFSLTISWIIDDIIDILNAANLDKILKRIDIRGKKDKDPIIFFYEDFLNFYEPERRKLRGVYYTPRPIVNFIVNFINIMLKRYFNKPLGFAEDDVYVLDPAIGTGTFFWIAFLLVLGELKNANLKGLIYNKIKNHLLKHFYGFEILITPYVISHLKLTDLLKHWHYNFKEKDRIQVYLTNTLKQSEVQGLGPFLREITEESRIAKEIKIKKPILVIMGNPPYAGISANKGKWIDDLLKEGYKRADGSKDDGYYKVNGKPLDEKNPKWLQDDYVKFIRFAQWKIDQNGKGIVGFITNHSYLDNPTFRGMRESLLQSFDRIYILNLHGNALKKETCPDGSKDENVFDIKQGVAISIFIKNNLKDKKVFYADLYGLRKYKYQWLDRHTINNVNWREIKPVSPYYFFIPEDNSLSEEYKKYWKITDIFSVNSVGIVTARDGFVIDFDKEVIKQRVEMLRDNGISDEYIKSKFKLKDKKGWKLRDARRNVMKNKDWKDSITKILYRPFDVRYIFYNDAMIERSRKEVMKYLLKENLGLIVSRNSKPDPWRDALVTDHIVEFGIIATRPGNAAPIFPLYLYSNSEKKPNFSPEFLKFIYEKYGREIPPEEIFYYIYAVLHSPTYRKKYEEFLKYDFPRIPFVGDYEKFRKISKLGKELVELHLMKKRLPIHTKFDVQGSNIVKKVKYEDGKVFINNEQYFDDVPEDVWNFYIGGYQVLSKWLKSRKNRELSGKEIEQFLQIVEIIKETIKIMKEIGKTNFQ